MENSAWGESLGTDLSFGPPLAINGPQIEGKESAQAKDRPSLRPQK